MWVSEDHSFKIFTFQHLSFIPGVVLFIILFFLLFFCLHTLSHSDDSSGVCIEEPLFLNIFFFPSLLFIFPYLFGSFDHFDHFQNKLHINHQLPFFLNFLIVFRKLLQCGVSSFNMVTEEMKNHIWLEGETMKILFRDREICHSLIPDRE